MRMRKILMLRVVPLLFAFATVCEGQGSRPRVYLQAASHGNVWNARRDQAMEMAKDFQRDCRDVTVTINQNAADYTILLNHIEVGFMGRDNQFQVVNKDGDMLTLREKSGLKSRSISSGVKAACDLILADWKEHDASGDPLSSGMPAASLRTSDPVASAEPSPTPTIAKTEPVASASTGTNPSSPLITSISSGSSTVSANSLAISPRVQDDINSLGLVLRNSDQGGAEIVRIVAGSSASTEGLHVGDVITAVDGKRIRSVSQFADALSNRQLNKSVRIGYLFHSNLGWMNGTQKVLTIEK